ncbi:uncharacterized protein LTR77_007580 [Saxophila tyrrhenica]|uniref:Uncharacterized protein n=1 Tax=Saxophila tyrrhenica TaxID=1690608 RepID=A0AAV9P393_9PEZI|nr:hypothetical protein LTR77_007580 [Saxophila tyrrhenica]
MARITFLATLLAAFLLLLSVSAGPLKHKGKHYGGRLGGSGKDVDADIDDDDDDLVKPHRAGAQQSHNNRGKDAADFHFKPSHKQHITCPSSSGTLWTGGRGTKFGILCGWDTQSHTYHYPPLHHLSFEHHVHDCTVATYVPRAGCYLEKHANGRGYVKSGKNTQVMTAIKMNKGGDVGKDRD